MSYCFPLIMDVYMDLGGCSHDRVICTCMNTDTCLHVARGTVCRNVFTVPKEGVLRY